LNLRLPGVADGWIATSKTAADQRSSAANGTADITSAVEVSSTCLPRTCHVTAAVVGACTARIERAAVHDHSFSPTNRMFHRHSRCAQRE